VVGAGQSEAEGEPPPEKLLQVGLLMMGGAIKFLAKRRKEDGPISALLVGVVGNERQLLARLDWAEESEYRQAVADFEVDFLREGVLTEPQVVTLEEWRRYTR